MSWAIKQTQYFLIEPCMIFYCSASSIACDKPMKCVLFFVWSFCLVSIGVSEFKQHISDQDIFILLLTNVFKKQSCVQVVRMFQWSNIFTYSLITLNMQTFLHFSLDKYFLWICIILYVKIAYKHEMSFYFRKINV